MPRLIVIQGPDQGQVFDVGRTVSIGRLSANEIRLRDEQASRTHARLEVSNGSVVAVDLGSRKGTQVNGRTVDRQRLAHGDSLLIGTTVLRFETDDGPPPLPDEGGPHTTADTRVPAELAAAGPAAMAQRRPSRAPTRPPGPAADDFPTGDTPGPIDMRPKRLAAITGARRTTGLEILLGAAILVLVFWASKWVGQQAVLQVLKDRPSGEKR